MASKKPSIIVPLDGSAISARALGAAQAIASMMGARLHAVHVTRREMPETELRERLGLAGADKIALHQLRGEVVDSILSFATEMNARMIVMSGHGESDNQRHLAGSTALALMGRADIPILVIRSGMQRIPTPEWHPQRLLAPLDGTPDATQALDEVIHIARDLGIAVDILYIAVVGKEPSKAAGAITSPRYLDYPQYDWPAWSDEFMRRCYEPHKDEVTMRLFHREGEPATVVSDFARENADDLVALSWHGSMQKRIATTVKGVLRHAQLPVLLVRVP
ncbi:MAG: universal stress protein [Candidatus Geothermincolia bacterium]